MFYVHTPHPVEVTSVIMNEDTSGGTARQADKKPYDMPYYTPVLGIGYKDRTDAQ